MVRHLLIFCGALSLVLGIIGIFLPFLPTTPFILLTATCWAQASPRFHNWLYHHRYLAQSYKIGKTMVPCRVRQNFFAIGMMTFSCLLMFWRFPERWWIGVISSILLQLRGCVDVAAAGSINKTGRHCCLPVFYFIPNLSIKTISKN